MQLTEPPPYVRASHAASHAAGRAWHFPAAAPPPASRALGGFTSLAGSTSGRSSDSGAGSEGGESGGGESGARSSPQPCAPAGEGPAGRGAEAEGGQWLCVWTDAPPLARAEAWSSLPETLELAGEAHASQPADAEEINN